MNHFTIDTSHSGLWFSLIYLLTFIMVISVFMVKGLKKHHRFVSLWLIAITGILFFIAGSELFPLSLEDWKSFITTGAPSQTGAKSLLGGMLGFGGFLLAIYWLKEEVSLIDNMAVVFVIAMGIQNIGCLKAGCCYGNQATIPWAVQYDRFSPAFGYQLRQGITQLTDTLTTPLHPAPLYLLIGCLLIAFVVWKIRNRIHAPLSLLFFGWMLYAILRFGVEFFRNPSTNRNLGISVYGLEAVQWYLLVMIAVLGFFIYLRERSYQFKLKTVEIEKTELAREISLLMFIIILSWLFKGLFGFTEKLLLNSCLVIAVLILGWKVFKTFTLPQYRIATLVSVFGSFILLSQSYIPVNANEKVTYTEIGGGLQISQFYSELAKSIGEQTDCNGNKYYATSYPNRQVNYNSLTGGISFAKVENLNKYKRFGYGINAYFGADRGKGIDTSYSKTLPIIAAHPYFTASNRWAGVSAGLHLGTFHFADRVTEASQKNVGKMVHEPRNLYIYPSLSFWIGLSDIVYLESAIANQFISASPLMLYSFGIGSGLGEIDGRNIGIGYATSGFYFKSLLPVKENYYLDGFVSFQPNTPNHNEIGKDSRFSLSVGLHHRINYKTVARKANN